MKARTRSLGEFGRAGLITSRPITCVADASLVVFMQWHGWWIDCTQVGTTSGDANKTQEVLKRSRNVVSTDSNVVVHKTLEPWLSCWFQSPQHHETQDCGFVCLMSNFVLSTRVSALVNIDVKRTAETCQETTERARGCSSVDHRIDSFEE